jgi:hypothetical protein
MKMDREICCECVKWLRMRSSGGFMNAVMTPHVCVSRL